MIQSGLFLLPLAALVLIFRFTWLGNDSTLMFRSRKLRRRYRAKVILHRCLIASLVLATLVAALLSQSGPLMTAPSLLVGAVVIAIAMAPVIVTLLVWEFKAAKGDEHHTPTITVESELPEKAVSVTETASIPPQPDHIAVTDTPVLAIDLGIPKQAPVSANNLGLHQPTREELMSQIDALKELINQQNIKMINERKLHQVTQVSLEEAKIKIDRLKHKLSEQAIT